MSRRDLNLDKLSRLYDNLVRRLGEVERAVGNLSKDFQNLKKQVERIENVLIERGILVPHFKVVGEEKITLYYWVHKNKKKEVLTRGIRPEFHYGTKEELELFKSVLRNRGLKPPDKFVIAYLTPKPPMKPEFIGRYVMFKFWEYLRYVYVGDATIFNVLVELTSPEERRELIVKFANTITPATVFRGKEIPNAEKYVALVTRAIPPDRLTESTEYMMYLREEDVWDYNTGWYKV